MGGGIRQYYWIIDLVGIFLCAFFLAKVTSVYLGKAMEVKRSVAVLKASDVALDAQTKISLAEYDVIVDRDMFDASDVPTEGDASEAGGEEEAQVQTSGEAVLTSLGIKVVGVLVVGKGTDSRSSATISGPGGGGAAPARGRAPAAGGAEVYAVGDEDSFAPNTKLMKVQPDRIEFLNNGRLEYAEVLADGGESIFGPPPTGPVAASTPSAAKAPADANIRQEGEGQFAVDRREIDEAVQNLDKLYTEIRAVPNFAGGKVSGMKVLSVKNGSIFAKLGLRRGDVLQKINGLELDVKRGFEIFNKLKEESNIRLDLIRQGQPTTLEYEIR